MKWLNIKSSVFYCFFLLACSSCKQDVAVKTERQATVTAAARPVPSPTTVPAICNYNLDEAALTSAGWTKSFEDDFNADLSKWNIWTGGAFNNELQYYHAGNLQVANSNLVITTKKETITGATTPFDPTPKTFEYTSGRIECK